MRVVGLVESFRDICLLGCKWFFLRLKSTCCFRWRKSVKRKSEMRKKWGLKFVNWLILLIVQTVEWSIISFDFLICLYTCLFALPIAQLWTCAYGRCNKDAISQHLIYYPALDCKSCIETIENLNIQHRLPNASIALWILHCGGESSSLCCQTRGSIWYGSKSTSMRLFWGRFCLFTLNKIITTINLSTKWIKLSRYPHTSRMCYRLLLSKFLYGYSLCRCKNKLLL